MLSVSPGTIVVDIEVPLAYPRKQIGTRSDPRYLHLREHRYRNMVTQVMKTREEHP
jgi:hypothetical protein